MDREKLLKLAGGAARSGGKGAPRRKQKAVHKTASSDDKRLQATLKRLGVNAIPGIEEVGIFTDDGKCVHFQQPKVQASIAANTYVVSGASVVRDASEVASAAGPAGGGMPDLAALQRLMMQNQARMQAGGGGGAAALGAAAEEDDGDVPELVENFDEQQ
jgi:nascent polypeptide-associated complex subunit beta